jgi:hypothetical protein
VQQFANNTNDKQPTVGNYQIKKPRIQQLPEGANNLGESTTRPYKQFII